MSNSTNHSIQQIEHSAIGSWAGYIYQGVCAAIESVRLLIDDNDSNNVLCLDLFNDFAILDSSGLILSFHQCKDIKGDINYTDAFSLMIDAKNYYSGQLHPEVRLFFHCNNDVTPPNDIELYEFPNGEKKCPPGKIYENLQCIVKKYLDKNHISNINNEYASARLSEAIQQKILDVQQKFFNSHRELLKVVAERESKIPLQEIKNIICDSSLIAVNDENFYAYIKQEFVRHFYKSLRDDDLDLPQEQKMKEIFDDLKSFSLDDWKECIQRINPDIIARDGLTSIASQDRVDVLYDLIKMIEKEKFQPKFYLKNTETTSLSTISGSNIKRLCKRIVETRYNIKSLYEIRWLVADIGQKIDDVEKEIPRITKPQDDLNTGKPSIFDPKCLGLLPIGSYNNDTH